MEIHFLEGPRLLGLVPKEHHGACVGRSFKGETPLLWDHRPLTARVSGMWGDAAQTTSWGEKGSWNLSWQVERPGSQRRDGDDILARFTARAKSGVRFPGEGLAWRATKSIWDGQKDERAVSHAPDTPVGALRYAALDLGRLGRGGD